ncbi:MAG: type II secretion protein F [Actinomycetes bacterium]
MSVGWLAAALVGVAVLLLAPASDRRLRSLTASPVGAQPPRPASPRWPRVPRRRRREAEALAEMAALVSEVAVLLRAGLSADVAWRHAAGAGGVGGAPGGERALTGLTATWQVAQRTGAPTADVLLRYAASLRADAAAADAREAALAAPRATARLLVGLPPAGLLLGSAVGADPVSVLLGTPAGRVSAAAGAVFALAGWWWTRRLLASGRGS